MKILFFVTWHQALITSVAGGAFLCPLEGWRQVWEWFAGGLALVLDSFTDLSPARVVQGLILRAGKETHVLKRL